MSSDIPMMAAFKLKGIVKQIDEASSNMEEARKASLKRFTKKKEDGEMETDDKGNVVFSDDESRNSFFKEYQDLLDGEAEVGNVRVQELGDKVSITVVDLLNLEDIVVQ
jgi:hypothetical protein